MIDSRLLCRGTILLLFTFPFNVLLEILSEMEIRFRCNPVRNPHNSWQRTLNTGFSVNADLLYSTSKKRECIHSEKNDLPNVDVCPKFAMVENSP